MIWHGVTTLVLLATAVATARAQQRATPDATHERPVMTSGAGPQKLPVDVHLLTAAQRFTEVVSDGETAHARGGLADLRLFDQAGREIGYLLVTPGRRRAAWAQPAVLPIAQTEKASGFEVDLGRVRDVNALAVDGLPRPFLKRFVLEGSGDRSHWTVLIAEGTLFDLPEEGVRQTQVAFARGAFRYLRVTWDDTNSARVPLPRHVRVREAVAAVRTAPLHAPVSVQRQASEPGRSRVRIRLPAAGLPVVALLADAGPGDVFRTAAVIETRFSGMRADPFELGRARLVRMERPGGSPAPLRIAIQPPQSSELQLVIEDGNNPPLSIQSVAAEFAELPWIYFEAPGGPITARYGNPAARAPQYDLEVRRAAIDLEAVPTAAWGEPRAAMAAAAPLPPEPVAPDRGSRLDPAAFQYRRPIPEGERGLVALQLDGPVLAHSRGPSASFADVRVVDAEGHQIPYLAERRAEPLSVDLSLKAAAPRVRMLREAPARNRSIHAIALPYPNLPDPRLVLETSDRVFRRSMQIGVERPPDRRQRDVWLDVLATPTWQHVDSATAAPPLEIPIASGDATELLVIVDEGDNRPLTITTARLLLPSWRLRFFRPAGSLWLIYGKQDSAAPEYDLSLLAPAVMGGEAKEISAAAEEPSRAARPDILPRRVFWIGIGLAVLVLLVLIARLIASADPPAPVSPGS